MKTKDHHHPDTANIEAYVKEQTSSDNLKHLFAHIQELKHHISKQSINSKSLKEQINKLKKENQSLQKINDFLINNVTEFINFTAYKHPPHFVAENLDITSKQIGKIVKDLKLDEISGVCFRVPRVKKKLVRKHETTLLFSVYGIKLMDLILQYCLDHPESYPVGHKYATIRKENREETEYILSIPGMKESIKEGLDTPLDECVTELNW